ncbi:hypothetical protein [Nocardia cyriacigeorgica]|uniref:hypothetical protein n=1 Tax=Nocardia cyriacigeorgica TaxID=135487 RepID=UPI0024588D66|nr:hypothetical protein [Nocardia cyriacigeorgica]
MFDPPAMPPSALALIESGRLPKPLVEHFGPDHQPSSEPGGWNEIAWAIYLQLDNPALDPDVRCPLALLGAYAFIKTCEYEFQVLVKRSELAMELLSRAEKYGIGEEEIDPLNKWAYDAYEAGAGIR